LHFYEKLWILDINFYMTSQRQKKGILILYEPQIFFGKVSRYLWEILRKKFRCTQQAPFFFINLYNLVKKTLFLQKFKIIKAWPFFSRGLLKNECKNAQFIWKIKNFTYIIKNEWYRHSRKYRLAIFYFFSSSINFKVHFKLVWNH